MKKILSLVLVCILIFCSVPFGALAEETEDITSYFGFSRWNNNTAWLITDCDETLSGDIVIPSEYLGKPIVGIQGGAFYNCDLLTSVTIPESVTEIYGGIPFRDCDLLQTLKIPASLESIGELIVSDCIALTEIIVDGNNPHFCSVDGVLFNKDKTELLFYPGNKQNLSYTVPDTVKTLGTYSFKDSQILTELIIPDSVETIEKNLFYNSLTKFESALQKITIGKGVKSIGENAFWRCNDITHVNISDVGAWCGIDFANAFANPMHVNSVYTQAEKTIYLNGEPIVDLVIPDGVTEIKKYAFRNCKSIETVNMPDSVTSIGVHAFAICKALKKVVLSKNLTELGSVFGECPALEDIIIPDGVTTLDNTFSSCYALKSINIPESVKTINNAFYHCNGLESVYTPSLEAWCNISFTSVSSPPASQLGTNLYIGGELATDIVIPDTITKIGPYTFRYYTSIKSVTIPESVTAIGSCAFIDCNAITSIKMHDGITSIANSAFNGCKSLASIEIPKGITSISNHTFANCEALTEIKIPENVTSIGEYAFSGCKSLAEITIPSSITSIGGGTFSNCQKQKNVYIDDIQTWYNLDFSAYGASPFHAGSGKLYVNNELFTDLELPEGTQSVEAMKFAGITSIKNVFIPKTVTAMGNEAFRIYYMENVYYEGTAEEWAAIDFATGNTQYFDYADIYFGCKGIPAEIKVTGLPEKTEYIEKTEDLDLTGGILTVNYKNGKTEELDLANAEITGFDNTVLGEQTLTVKYYGLTTEFTVNIIPRPTTLIAISKLPDKVKYNFGEVLDVTGGEIVVCYTDGTYEVKAITIDMISGLDLNVGFKTLNVNYNGKQAQFMIVVYRNPDLDHNGMVSATDVAILKKSLLTSDNQNEDLDLNVDGSLDVLDLIHIKKAVS